MAKKKVERLGKQKPKVYLTPESELIILQNRVKANEHDRIYIYELPAGKGKSVVAETMLSPGKAGYVCLGAL